MTLTVLTVSVSHELVKVTSLPPVAQHTVEHHLSHILHVFRKADR